MGTHVIVGAGAVGTATAEELVARGHRVRLVSRSGSGPDRPGVELVAADASRADDLAALTAGADALYNAANPPYHRWSQDWPPLAASLLAAAERTGAALVTMSNLYVYGPTDHPLVESDPLAATGAKGRVRVAMWEEALAAHRAGRIRMAEARASDFIGPGLGDTSHLGRIVEPLLAGRRAMVIGSLDAPHSWTFVPDVGRTLATLGTDPRAWGRAWHVPSPPPVTQRRLAGRLCELAGVSPPRLTAVPGPVLTVAGLCSARMRELREVRHQFDRPFVLDTRAATEEFGIEATPLDEALSRILAGAGAGAGPDRVAAPH